MNPVFRFLKKLSILFSRTQFRSELDEEMGFHRAEAEKALVADRHVACGCSLRSEATIRECICAAGAE